MSDKDDCISRQAALDMLDEQIELCNKALSAFDISLKDEYAVKVEKASLKAYKEQLENLPSAQPNLQPTCNQLATDTISRQAALKKLAVYIHLIDKTMGKGLLTDDDCMEAAKSVLGEDELPAAQPEIIRCKNCKYMIDTGDDLMCDNAKGWVVATTSDFGCVLAERRTE